jgi:hypothetical protein
LLGYIENRAGFDGEPFIILLPGEERPLSSLKVEAYLGSEFWYYYRVFTNCENCGLPHGAGWAGERPWVIQLINYFKNTVEQVRAFNYRKAYGG